MTKKETHLPKLSTFLYLPLQVPFLILQVLQPEVRVVHLRPGLRTRLLPDPRRSIRSTIQRFEACKEGRGPYLDYSWIDVEVGGLDERVEVLDDRVWIRRCGEFIRT